MTQWQEDLQGFSESLSRDRPGRRTDDLKDDSQTVALHIGLLVPIGEGMETMEDLERKTLFSGFHRAFQRMQLIVSK